MSKINFSDQCERLASALSFESTTPVSADVLEHLMVERIEMRGAAGLCEMTVEGLMVHPVLLMGLHASWLGDIGILLSYDTSADEVPGDWIDSQMPLSREVVHSNLSESAKAVMAWAADVKLSSGYNPLEALNNCMNTGDSYDQACIRLKHKAEGLRLVNVA